MRSLRNMQCGVISTVHEPIWNRSLGDTPLYLVEDGSKLLVSNTMFVLMSLVLMSVGRNVESLNLAAARTQKELRAAASFSSLDWWPMSRCKNSSFMSRMVCTRRQP